MAREQVKFEAPVGRLYTQALREEALLDEKNEKFSSAIRLRRLADKLDAMTDMYKNK